jgi:hypothetical protein
MELLANALVGACVAKPLWSRLTRRDGAMGAP